MDKKQFLEYAKQNKELIESAARIFHPSLRLKDPEYPITAKCAEAASIPIREEIKRDNSKGAVDFQDADSVVSFANEIWFGMPESEEIRKHPSFSVVCNLAEGYSE